MSVFKISQLKMNKKTLKNKTEAKHRIFTLPDKFEDAKSQTFYVFFFPTLM